MALLSLNKAYEDNVIQYLCNTCGDVIDPKDPSNMKLVEADKVMAAKELVLYQRYWEEGAGCYMYVIRVNGEPAIRSTASLFRQQINGQLEEMAMSLFGSKEKKELERLKSYMDPEQVKLSDLQIL